MESERERLIKALAEGFVGDSGWGVARVNAKAVVDALDAYLDRRFGQSPQTPQSTPGLPPLAFNFGSFPA